MGHWSINRTWKYLPLGIYLPVTSFEAVMQIRVGPNSRPIHLIYFLSLEFYLCIDVLFIYLLADSFCLLRRGNISVMWLLSSSTMTYSFMRISRILVRGESWATEGLCFRYCFQIVSGSSLGYLLVLQNVLFVGTEPVSAQPSFTRFQKVLKLKLDYSGGQWGFCKETCLDVPFCALLWRMGSNPDSRKGMRASLGSKVPVICSRLELEDRRSKGRVEWGMVRWGRRGQPSLLCPYTWDRFLLN